MIPVKKPVIRYNQTEIGEFTKTDEGYLIGKALISSFGVLLYILEDNEVQYELKSKEEVFSEDSKASVLQKPITWMHPDEVVDSGNYDYYAVGHVGEDLEETDKGIWATIIITSKWAVEEILKRGGMDLSPGYTTILTPLEGTLDDKEYKFSQTKILYNHFALVEQGREGKEVAVRLNSKGNQIQYKSNKGESRMKFTLDGQVFESESAAQSYVDGLKSEATIKTNAAETRANAADNASDKLQTDYTELKAKNDVMEQELVLLRKNVAEKTLQDLTSKVELFGTTTEAFKAEKIETVTAGKKFLLRENAKALGLDADYSDKDDAYISVAFDQTELLIRKNSGDSSVLTEEAKELLRTNKKDEVDGTPYSNFKSKYFSDKE